MDTRQLTTLVAIAEHGTFARAAEVVHITPSAVSQQVAALEAEMGVALFNRETRPPSLNMQGLLLVETARHMLRMMQDTRSVLQGKRVAGSLSIGAVRTSAIGLLPRAIVALRDVYPELRISLRVGLSAALIADVLADRLDMAVVAEHVGVPQSLSWAPFIREPLVLIAPPGTPGTVNEIVRTMPYVRFRANVPLAHLIDTELARLGLTPENTAEIDTVSAIVECVSAGLGVSVVPDIALREMGAACVRLPFGDPQIFRQIGIVRSASSPKDALFNDMHRKLAQMAGIHGIPPRSA